MAAVGFHEERSGHGGVGQDGVGAAGSPLPNDDLLFAPAVELAARMRRRELSPVELIDRLFARIADVNARLGAYCTLAQDQAREQARQAEAAVLRGDDL